MSLGYLGYCLIGDTTPDTLLLCNSTGLNRGIEPLMSQAVYGSGWRNPADVVAYADNQQAFEGGIAFDLQATPTIWNHFRQWIADNRIVSKSCRISPNGTIYYDYIHDNADPRSGVWLKSASFTVSAESIITVSSEAVAIKRSETDANTQYASITYGISKPASFTDLLMNPSPYNRNPLPGWQATASVVWPGAPAFWVDLSSPYGMVLREMSINVNNNTQIIRGCTGDKNPVAVLQGTVGIEGDITLWRDGGIPDPYGKPDTPFTAHDSSVVLNFGGSPAATISLDHILLQSDAYDVVGQNNPSERKFGIKNIGDATNQSVFRMSTL